MIMMDLRIIPFRRSWAPRAAAVVAAVFLVLAASCTAPDKGAYPPVEALPETEFDIPGDEDIPMVRVLVLETGDRIRVELPGGSEAT